jgi:hypothetical protein
MHPQGKKHTVITLEELYEESMETNESKYSYSKKIIAGKGASAI